MTARNGIVLATSIPPSLSRRDGGEDVGAAYQRLCVRSWCDCGFRILSVNDESEIAELSARHPDVEFVPTARNASAITGRKNPYIADLIAALLATDAPHLGIVNSDIVFEPCTAWQSQLPAILDDSVAGLQRLDTHALREGALRRFYWGYDAFFFGRAAAREFADCAGEFAMGLPWWDYWLPAAAVLKGRSFRVLERPFAMHLSHSQGYNSGAAAQFTSAFAEFVAARGDEAAEPLSAGLAQFVAACRAFAADTEAPVYGEKPFDVRLTDDIEPWRLALLANPVRLTVEAGDTGVAVEPGEKRSTLTTDIVFGDLARRLSAGRTYEHARYLRKEGNLNEAARQLQTALELAPGDFAILSEFGEFLCHAGEYKHAIVLLEAARKQKIDTARLLNNLGFALRALNRREEAIADFEQALRIDPEFRDASYNLAVTLFETRGAQDAVACLDAALVKWPGAADFARLRTAMMSAAGNAKA